MSFYRGQHNPPLDQVIHERYFQGVQDGFFIEAGAIDGLTIATCYFFEKTLRWNGLNLEPVPAMYAALRMNRPKATNLQVALSNKNGYALFTQAIMPEHGQRSGNGSLLHDVEHLQQLIDMGCAFEAYPVPLITYRTLVKLLGLKRVDLMVLDVEGHELQVVEGMADAQVLPRVFVVENNHADLPAITRWLTSFGYREDEPIHNNSAFVL